MVNHIELSNLRPAAGSFRSRSDAYAGVKAMLLSMAGRSRAGGFVDVVRGHAEMVRQNNVHDALTPLCHVIDTDHEGRKLWNTPGGDLWTACGATAKYVAGIVAEQVVGSYQHPALPSLEGRYVIDCGANIGVFTREALRRGAKLVVAVEPSRENALCFRRNLAAEIHTGRVILMEKGVSDSDGEFWLNTSNSGNPGSWSVSTRVVSQGHPVTLTTVDRIVEELSLPSVDMMKIDVEGCELAVVKGSRATLARFKPSFVVAAEHTDEDVIELIPAISKIDGVAGRYRCRCGFYRCDDSRRLLPQILYFIAR